LFYLKRFDSVGWTSRNGPPNDLVSTLIDDAFSESTRDCVRLFDKIVKREFDYEKVK